MNAEELWQKFCAEKNINIKTPYEAWAFGDGENDADILLDKVLSGLKFGTAGAWDEYDAYNELDELPKPGEYSVILDSKENAICVVKTYDVEICNFNKVTPFHSYSEGEKKRNLQSWREIHTRVFTPYLEEVHRPLNDNSKIVCEKFSIEYCVKDIPSNIEDNFIFTEPSITFAEQLKSFKNELVKNDSLYSGLHGLETFENIEDYINYCKEYSDPENLFIEDKLSGTVLLCIRKSDNKIVGAIEVNYKPDAKMKEQTGYVNFCVAPSERGKNYAKIILHKTCDFLSTFDFPFVIVTCDSKNIAARKTIISCGGTFAKTIFLEDKKVNLEQFYITPNKTGQEYNEWIQNLSEKYIVNKNLMLDIFSDTNYRHGNILRKIYKSIDAVDNRFTQNAVFNNINLYSTKAENFIPQHKYDLIIFAWPESLFNNEMVSILMDNIKNKNMLSKDGKIILIYMDEKYSTQEEEMSRLFCKMFFADNSVKAFSSSQINNFIKNSGYNLVAQEEFYFDKSRNSIPLSLDIVNEYDEEFLTKEDKEKICRYVKNNVAYKTGAIKALILEQ